MIFSFNSDNMEQKNQIKLTIPTIDLSLLKRMKGGYSLYGGEIEAAYCEADGPGNNYPDADDGWTPKIDTLDPKEFEDYDFSQDNDGEDSDFSIIGSDFSNIQEDDNLDSQHEEGQQDNNEVSGPDDIAATLSGDSLMTDEIVSQLLAGTGIDYQFNQEWLDEKCKGNYSALGAALFSGDVLPDGTIATHDTIILGNNATYDAYLEELFHIWQGNTLYHGEGSPRHSTSAMEFMEATFEYIGGLFEGNYLNPSGSDALPLNFIEVIYDCFNFDEENPVFNWESFFAEWDRSFFEAWDSLHDSDPYGRGDDQDFEWDWRAAYEWMVEHNRV